MIDWCWQSILVFAKENPAVFSASAITLFWGVKYIFGPKMYLIVCGWQKPLMHPNNSLRWYQQFNLHDWDMPVRAGVITEEFKDGENHGVRTTRPRQFQSVDRWIMRCKRCKREITRYSLEEISFISKVEVVKRPLYEPIDKDDSRTWNNIVDILDKKEERKRSS